MLLNIAFVFVYVFCFFIEIVNYHVMEVIVCLNDTS